MIYTWSCFLRYCDLAFSCLIVAAIPWASTLPFRYSEYSSASTLQFSILKTTVGSKNSMDVYVSLINVVSHFNVVEYVGMMGWSWSLFTDCKFSHFCIQILYRGKPRTPISIDIYLSALLLAILCIKDESLIQLKTLNPVLYGG